MIKTKTLAKALTVEISRPFLDLIESRKRYKFYYGGRGGGKSYAFADSLLVLGLKKNLFIACLREIQDTIKDSVHKLLSDRISLYGLNEYEIKDSEIVNRINGTRFIFKGLRDQDAGKIKSLEGVDICWIEEGQTITKKSWEILDPTIRKDGSQIWVSMNREEENDPLWTILGAHPDDRTLVRKVNYTDNPFCPEEIKTQAEKCKKEDYEAYLHIWEGEPVSQGNKKLIGSKEVHKAFEANVSFDNNSLPLIIGCDPARFGDDKTAICRRRGRQIFGVETYAKKNVVEVANILSFIIQEEKPLRVNIDIGGLGAGVYDILADRGFGTVARAVNFGEKAQAQDRYFNRRAEMWDRMRQWLCGNIPVGIIKKDNILEDLTAPEKKYDSYGRLQLESKEDIRKRIGRSTDIGDAMALTFAEMSYQRDLPGFYEEDTDMNMYID